MWALGLALTFPVTTRIEYKNGLCGSVWVSEGDDEVEILVIEAHIENYPIRIINAYGPQESDSIERKSSFWSRLHTEVNDAMTTL